MLLIRLEIISRLFQNKHDFNTFAYITLLVKCSLMVKCVGHMLEGGRMNYNILGIYYTLVATCTLSHITKIW